MQSLLGCRRAMHASVIRRPRAAQYRVMLRNVCYGPALGFDFVTNRMSSMSNRHMHFPVPEARAAHMHVSSYEAVSAQSVESARISAVWHLPRSCENSAWTSARSRSRRVRPDIFSDRENLIDYAALARLLLECERQSHCDTLCC